MSQAHHNHIMILHYHQDYTDNLDIKQISNDFINAKETRQNILLNLTTFQHDDLNCKCIGGGGGTCMYLRLHQRPP